MPVESVAAYINNTFTFVLFVLVCILLYLIIFLISTGLRKRMIQRNQAMPYRETDGREGGKSFTGIDPFKTKTTAIMGMSFVLIFLSVMLILASFYFSMNINLSIVVSIICLIILAMIAVLVYMFRSGALNK
jgi:NADH:ubiquinone oxidoreductase subunit 3 (subunit A)